MYIHHSQAPNSSYFPSLLGIHISVSLFLLCKYSLIFPGSLSQCGALEFGVPERGSVKSLGGQEMNELECICVLHVRTMGFSCPALGIMTWANSL